MANDLFSAAIEERLARTAPLADRMRPQNLDEVVGQTHLLGPRGTLRALIETDRLGSVILWGPPGTGKTTLARLVATATKRRFLAMSAVTAGVKDVRLAVDEARQRLGEQGQGTILFLDEVHRFNKSQQDALLPAVEDGTLTLIGATTENPFFEVNPPLLSRSTLFRLESLTEDDLETLAWRALEREGVTADSAVIRRLADVAGGDGRSMLTSLEVAIALAQHEHDEPGNAVVVVMADVERAAAMRTLRYNDDEHYDVVSAFIKSIRGSDVDAGVYWLARMLAGGEDARFIARRLVILASEDIGEADPQSLVLATAAAHAVEYVGLPEAGLNLAQAVVHLASAPKSNRSAMALWDAQADIRDRPSGPVPAHLRDAHYRGAVQLGHGDGYRYPHDDPSGWVDQEYRPPGATDRRYYVPSSHGFEEKIRARMEQRRASVGSDGNE